MKKINLEMIVGLFVIGGFFAFGYISLQFGEFSFLATNNYTIQAEFQNVSGLKEGAVIEIAGVTVGRVDKITLAENDQAKVAMRISDGVTVTEDAIASIRTQGIIGDKYIRISQGGSDVKLKDGDWIFETESAVDLEELVSKYIFGDL